MRRESGQVAVEAALVIPIWLLAALGAIQLALIQHARLVTEYGAYCAARTGSVWSGNNERMRDAALLAILPSFGATSSWEALGRTYSRAREVDRKLHDAIEGGSPAPIALRQSGLLGMVRVSVLSPRSFQGPELDFDSTETLSGDHRRAYEAFAAGRLDPAAEARRDETVLTVRLRYLYELRLPFVNAGIFSAWHLLRGAQGLSAEDATFIHAAADGEGPWPGAHRYFLPLTASWSQRLQSSFHRKWLTGDEVSQ